MISLPADDNHTTWKNHVLARNNLFVSPPRTGLSIFGSIIQYSPSSAVNIIMVPTLTLYVVNL